MRFALFYAPPPSSLLWKLGCKWLGWDALTQTKIKQDRFSEIAPGRISELTRIPRRYGLHATLKPPFSLAKGCDEGELRSAINDFSAQCCSFSTSPLVLRQINDFFCLCPGKQPLHLDALAASCVQKFDSFRAPSSRLELARRRAEILTDPQKYNLENWGYPYVLDEYRFHITLTARMIDASEKRLLHSFLSDVFSPVLGKPLEIEGICLFIEPATGQSFYYSDFFPFNKFKQESEEITPRVKSNILNQIINKSE